MLSLPEEDPLLAEESERLLRDLDLRLFLLRPLLPEVLLESDLLSDPDLFLPRGLDLDRELERDLRSLDVEESVSETDLFLNLDRDFIGFRDLCLDFDLLLRLDLDPDLVSLLDLYLGLLSLLDLDFGPLSLLDLDPDLLSLLDLDLLV